MTLPFVAIQTNLTFTAKRWGQVPTITFTNGATAGSEVVSVDSSDNITVQIASGTTTMLQIKTAVQNHTVTSGLSANDLVTVTIVSGHNSDTVKTLVNAKLAGGLTAAVKASLTVGPLLVKAVTAGTAGNSIRLRFTSGGTAGSEVVTVSTNDISVQIQDGVSSFGQIKDAIAASGAAAALVVGSSATGRSLYASPFYTALDSPTPNSQKAAHVADLSTYTNLAGGLAAAPAVVVVQGITITSGTNDSTQNGATFTATTGATAGAEVVTMTGNNISIQIQEGVSTITQVVTALQAAGSFTAKYTATGSSSTAVRTVNGAAMSGAVGPSPAGGAPGFYQDQAGLTLTTSFQFQAFGNMMESFAVYNDETTGSKTVIFSWDGINNHGSLLPTQSVQLISVNKPGIYLKEANGAPSYRVFATSR